MGKTKRKFKMNMKWKSASHKIITCGSFRYQTQSSMLCSGFQADAWKNGFELIVRKISLKGFIFVVVVVVDGPVLCSIRLLNFIGTNLWVNPKPSIDLSYRFEPSYIYFSVAFCIYENKRRWFAIFQLVHLLSRGKCNTTLIIFLYDTPIYDHCSMSRTYQFANVHILCFFIGVWVFFSRVFYLPLFGHPRLGINLSALRMKNQLPSFVKMKTSNTRMREEKNQQ